MAASDNPYYVRPANVFEALMAGNQAYGQAEMGAGQRAAEQALAQGDAQTALARLIGVGAAKGSDLAHYVQNAGSVYGTPIMLQKPDGTYAVGAIGKSGEGRIINFGDGLAATVPSKSVDTGTGTMIIPGRITGGAVSGGAGAVAGSQPGIAGTPAGVPGQYVPKDIAGAKRQAETGKGLGHDENLLASMQSKLPGLQTVVQKLDDLSQRATYTGAGQAVDYARRQLNITPRDAAVARAEYISTVDNQILPLLRDTFGAQFTQKEGETLRATLGDPNKAPPEKQAVLRAFIEQKVRDIEALQRRVGQPSNAPVTKTINGVPYFQGPDGRWYQ